MRPSRELSLLLAFALLMGATLAIAGNLLVRPAVGEQGNVAIPIVLVVLQLLQLAVATALSAQHPPLRRASEYLLLAVLLLPWVFDLWMTFALTPDLAREANPFPIILHRHGMPAFWAIAALALYGLISTFKGWRVLLAWMRWWNSTADATTLRALYSWRRFSNATPLDRARLVVLPVAIGYIVQGVFVHLVAAVYWTRLFVDQRRWLTTTFGSWKAEHVTGWWLGVVTAILIAWLAVRRRAAQRQASVPTLHQDAHAR